MRTRPTADGFSLIEVMVATLFLSAIALAVTQTLVAAMRVRAQSEQWMQAAQLAAEGIEQLRAGHPLRPISSTTGFERSGTTAPWSGHSGVQQLEVTVSWSDGIPHTVQLRTLARQ